MLWDNLGDYHRARVAELKRIHGSETIISADLGAQDITYEWENIATKGHFVLSSLPVDQPDVFNRWRNFVKLVRREKVTAVFFGGYGSKGYLFFILTCKVLGIKAFLSTEVWYRTNPYYHIVLGTYFRTLFKGLLMAGSRVMKHYEEKLHIPPAMMRKPYSVVDNKHFASGIRTVQPRPVLLCVARFRGHKNLEPLINAFGRSQLCGTWDLKIVGGGPLKPVLEQAAAKTEGVHLLNWLSYAEMPNLYASSDFFILPSLPESWGLVVNEAMAAGLPVALSWQTGCINDFVTPENGFGFDAASVEAILEALNKIAALSPTQRLKMGEVSKVLVNNFSLERYAQSLFELVYGNQAAAALMKQAGDAV